MSRRRSYDIDLANIQTLAQKLVSKSEYAYLREFAMNTNARFLPLIDRFIKINEKLGMHRVAEFWREHRELVLKCGEAIFLEEKGDILTHLGLKLGLTGEKRISGKPAAETLQ